MVKAFFIADVHLSHDHPSKQSLLLAFFEMVIKQQGDLYILGDFFDFWANNNKQIENNLTVLNKLKQLTSHGLKAGFLYGNRDFLISQKTLASFGVDFMGEEAEVILDTKKVFLTHGHTLCADDIQFIRYKKTIWPLFRLLDHIMPGSIENYIARRCIKQSKKIIETQNPSRLQFTQALLLRYFEKGIDVVISGHAHRIEKKSFGKKYFYALPHWEDDKGSYLLFNKGEFGLYEFRGPNLSTAI